MVKKRDDSVLASERGTREAGATSFYEEYRIFKHAIGAGVFFDVEISPGILFGDRPQEIGRGVVLRRHDQRARESGRLIETSSLCGRLPGSADFPGKHRNHR